MMKKWTNKRASAALVAGLVLGGGSATGVSAWAASDSAPDVPAQLTCGSPAEVPAGDGDGDGVTFGPSRPWAV